MIFVDDRSASLTAKGWIRPICLIPPDSGRHCCLGFRIEMSKRYHLELFAQPGFDSTCLPVLVSYRLRTDTRLQFYSVAAVDTDAAFRSAILLLKLHSLT